MTFAGVPAQVSTWSDSQISVTIPEDATTGYLVVNVPGEGAGSSWYVIRPYIKSLSPAIGIQNTRVTLTGRGLVPIGYDTKTLLINGAPVAVESWSDTEIVAVLPSIAAEALSVDIKATYEWCDSYEGYCNNTESNAVHYTIQQSAPVPVVNSITPTSGTLVTITGMKFGASQGTSTVQFNGVLATPLSSSDWSDTQIVVPVPSGASTGNISLQIGGASTQSPLFTVLSSLAISSIDPTSGPVGTPVTITGAGFGTSQGTVSFNGVAVPVPISWSDTQIVAAVPDGASTGPLVVAVGGVAASATFEVTAPPQQSSPLLKVRVNKSPGVVDLSDATHLDWIVWGVNNSTTGIIRKSATSLIGDLEVPATASAGGPYIRFNWVDGAPLQNGDAVGANIYTHTGSGFQFTAPAGTSVQTLKLYAGSYLAAKLQIELSDGSAAPVLLPLPSYTTEVDNTYMIDFRAASNGQTVTIKLISEDPDGWVAVQAAVLEPHKPEATISAPSDQLLVNSPVDLPMRINSSQYDASVIGAQINADGIPLFEMSAAPFSAVWSQTPPGHHRLAATVVDGNGLSGTAEPVEFDVIKGGGSIDVTLSDANPVTDLTTEGTADWVHWSESSDYRSRKAGVVPQISEYAVLGNHEEWSSCCSSSAFSFVDGTPIPDASLAANSGDSGIRTRTGVDGIGNGFQIQAPAGLDERVLKLYVGVGWAKAKLTVFLGDGSASVVRDWSLSNTGGPDTKVLAIRYRAASEDQKLTVQLTLDEDYDWGDVEVYAATLSGSAVQLPPRLTLLKPAVALPGDQISIFGVGFGSIQGDNFVQVNGAKADVTNWTPNRIDISVPSIACGGDVRVSINGTLTEALSFSIGGPIAVSVDKTSLKVGEKLVLKAVSQSCGTTVNGASWQVSAPAMVSLSVPQPWSSEQATLTAINPGTLSLVASLGNYSSDPITLSIVPANPPQITNVSSTDVWIGQLVTITGSGFGNTPELSSSSVSIGGTSVNIRTWSDTKIVFLVLPGATSGDLVVSVYGFESNHVFMNVKGVPIYPVISSVTPNPAAVGNVVRIYGSNFGVAQSNNSVLINGTAANVLSWSETVIVIKIPPQAYTGSLTVVAADVESQPISFTVLQPPVIGAITPGMTGEYVQILGANFGPGQYTSSLSFGPIKATAISSWSDSVISVQIPSGFFNGFVTVNVGGNNSNSFPYSLPSGCFSKCGAVANSAALTPGTTTLATGDSAEFSLVTNTGEQPVPVTWSVSDETLGTIDPHGNSASFAALSPGTATISARYTPAGGTELTATSTVTIVAALDLPEGSIVWSVPEFDSGSFIDYGFVRATPSSNSETAVFGIHQSYQANRYNVAVRAFSGAGQLLWQHSTGVDYRTMHPINGSAVAPTPDGGFVYFNGKALVAVDGKSGAPKWQLPVLDVLGPIAVSQSGTVFATIKLPTKDAGVIPVDLSQTIEVQSVLVALDGASGTRIHTMPLQASVSVVEGTPHDLNEIQSSGPLVLADGSAWAVVRTLNTTVDYPANPYNEHHSSLPCPWHFRRQEAFLDTSLDMTPDSSDRLDCWSVSATGTTTSEEQKQQLVGFLADGTPRSYTLQYRKIPKSTYYGTHTTWTFDGFEVLPGAEPWQPNHYYEPFWGIKASVSVGGYLFEQTDFVSRYSGSLGIDWNRAVTAGLNPNLIGPPTEFDGALSWTLMGKVGGPDKSRPKFKISAQETLGETPSSPLRSPGSLDMLLVPDGSGGLLYADQSIDNGDDQLVVRHVVDPRTSDSGPVFMLPSLQYINQLVVGENNTAYAAGAYDNYRGARIVAFDINGGEKWHYDPQYGGDYDAWANVEAALPGGGVAATVGLWEEPRQAFILDNSGTRTDVPAPIVDHIKPAAPGSSKWFASSCDGPLCGSALARLASTSSTALMSIDSTEIEGVDGTWSHPEANRAEKLKIPVHVYRVKEAGVSSTGIRTRINAGIKYWEKKAGILLDWDGTIEDVAACPNGTSCDWQNDPKSIYNVASVTIPEVRRRFGGVKGIKFLFAAYIEHATEDGGAILLSNHRWDRIAVFKADPNDVVPHELGHVFQLWHVGQVVDSSTSNLMCGPTDNLWQKWFLRWTFNGCSTEKSIELWDDQRETAVREANSIATDSQ